MFRKLENVYFQLIYLREKNSKNNAICFSIFNAHCFVLKQNTAFILKIILEQVLYESTIWVNERVKLWQVINCHSEIENLFFLSTF
jgi:hypothetical protein